MEDIIKLVCFILTGISSILTIIEFILRGKETDKATDSNQQKSNRFLVFLVLAVMFLILGLFSSPLSSIINLKTQINYNWMITRDSFIRSIVVYSIEFLLTVPVYIVVRIKSKLTSVLFVLFVILMVVFVDPLIAIWLGSRVLCSFTFETYLIITSVISGYFVLNLIGLVYCCISEPSAPTTPEKKS